MKIICKDIAVIREFCFDLLHLINMVTPVRIHINFLKQHKIRVQTRKRLYRPFCILFYRFPARRLAVFPRGRSPVLHLPRIHEETIIRSVCPESYIIGHRSSRSAPDYSSPPTAHGLRSDNNLPAYRSHSRLHIRAEAGDTLQELLSSRGYAALCDPSGFSYRYGYQASLSYPIPPVIYSFSHTPENMPDYFRFSFSLTQK